MSSLDQLHAKTGAKDRARRRKIPALENGDRLTRSEFERRYEAMPGDTKAELIGGVVYMASPTKAEHGDPHLLLDGWLLQYTLATRGTKASSNATVRLGNHEPQPDALLRVLPEAGGGLTIDGGGYFVGHMDLVCEVAASSAAYDLHDKKDLYEKHSSEYLVVVVHERTVLWFAKEKGRFCPLPKDRRGVIRSRQFPGLWLDTRALLAGDAAKLLATLRTGLESKEHAAFVKTLSTRLGRAKRRPR